MKPKLFALGTVLASLMAACASPATPVVQTVVVTQPPAVQTVIVTQPPVVQTALVTQPPVKETVIVKETVAAPVEVSWMVFETPALTASFWDTVIANGVKDSGVPGLTIKKLVTPGPDRTAYAKQL